jgi:hypothetical protein
MTRNKPVTLDSFSGTRLFVAISSSEKNMNISSNSARVFLLVLSSTFLFSTASLLASRRGWVTYDCPNLGSTNFLAGVAGISRSEAWAVGYAYDQSSTQVTVTQHWDGASWSIITSPNPGTAELCGAASYAGNTLSSVSALSARNVWAVGSLCGPGTARTLVIHWDGNGWSVIPSPNKSPIDDSELLAVSALAPNDVWAVGDYQVAFEYEWETLIEHWDGTAWSIVPSPNPAGSDITYLNGVSAVSSSDIWAVGYSHGGARPLIEHYDGQSWTIVAAPYPAQSTFNGLYAVTAISANDVWAVGYQNLNDAGQNGQGLILHWDGTQWSEVQSPIAGYATILLGVSANSSTSVDAVGYIQTRDVQYRPIAEHWNGTRWSVVEPSYPGRVGQLYGASAVNGSTWAVGAYSLVSMTQGYMENPANLILRNH